MQLRGDAVQVERDGLQDLLATEGQQLSDQGRRALRGLLHLGHLTSSRIPFIRRIEHEVGEGHDHVEHVVKVMGNATREAADGFHLLRRAQLLFKPYTLGFSLLVLGDVLDDMGQRDDLALFIDGGPGHQAVVLAALFVLANAGFALGDGLQTRTAGNGRGATVHQLETLLAQNLILASIQRQATSVIDLQNVVFAGNHEDDIGDGIEGIAPVFVRAAKSSLDALALGQLPLQFTGAVGNQFLQLLLHQAPHAVGRLELDHGPDLGHQLLVVPRFAEKGFGAEIEGPDPALAIGSERGQEDHRDVFHPCVGL